MKNLKPRTVQQINLKDRLVDHSVDFDLSIIRNSGASSPVYSVDPGSLVRSLRDLLKPATGQTHRPNVWRVGRSTSPSIRHVPLDSHEKAWSAFVDVAANQKQ